ncbi:heptaprenyl diphosphate synthase [Lachnoclostridium sp. An14]|uniref:Gx transporter family protein n=1 Tax=Lachnoclostridium sp. An14 TaxID=1965562 RepID=UPI000B3695E2|nr:Gx transporter family protein [Lachnoclostridium sp. An14]OUQ21496.1 heptaprenyl diphosphate synthase [Lachnoclostridium sp. An14]
MRNGRTARAEQTARYGMLIALAFVFSYIEAMIPIPFLVPGIKLGLANLVTMVGLYTVGPVGTAVVGVLRVVLVGFTFGNVFSMWYALSGCILSLICMILLKRCRRFGILGVSVAGGVAHNIGQLCMAAFVVESGSVFAYLPALLVAGVVAGSIIGLLGGLVVERVEGLFSR